MKQAIHSEAIAADIAAPRVADDKVAQIVLRAQLLDFALQTGNRLDQLGNAYRFGCHGYSAAIDSGLRLSA